MLCLSDRVATGGQSAAEELVDSTFGKFDEEIVDIGQSIDSEIV
jgi:hypothetical protein